MLQSHPINLFSLVNTGDVEHLRELTLAKKDLLMQDSEGLTLLDLARRNHFQKILNYFFEIAVNESRTGPNNSFVSKGEDIYGFSLLHWTILCNQPIDMIQRLLIVGADTSANDRPLHSRPIYLAERLGRNDVVQALAQHNPALLN